MIRQRPYGHHPFSFSEITFGSMRLPALASDAEGGRFLDALYDLGIDTHHSSHEYESQQRYLSYLAQVRGNGRTIKHIVKLACPQFGEEQFARDRFVRAVDRELCQLGAECLHNVQWLVRSQPIRDETRLRILERDLSEIESTFESLSRQGKVLSFSSFPYSCAFAQAVLEVNNLSGLTTYLNLVEREYTEFLKRAPGFLAIRPLAAGWLKGERVTTLPRELREPFATFARSLNCELDELKKVAATFPLLHPHVVSEIVSLNTVEQAGEIAALVAEMEPSLDKFQTILGQACALPTFEALAQ